MALALFFAWTTCTWSCGREPTPPTNRPNVVLVSIDTLRADHLSVYGYHRKTSPFLETFAQDATLFLNTYAHAPFTLTSHMSIFTSLFPRAHGVTQFRRLSNEVPIFTQSLKEAGYATLGFFTQDWLDPKFGFSRGFDRYEFKDDGAAVRDATLALLPELESRRLAPFFLFLHVRDVHSARGMKRPGNPLYNSPPEFRDAFLPHPEVKITDSPQSIWDGQVQITEEQAANVVAQYDGGILYVDSLLREIFDSLESHDLYEESLILVTSDHGESLGDRNVFKGHGSFWEEGLRVPLLVKLPESHPDREAWRGCQAERRVQSVDIAPTILKIAGLPIPRTFQGLDLFAPQARDVIAFRGDASVLIRGDHKLKLMPGTQATTELYDLANDPGETSSIDSDRTDLVRTMKGDLREYLRAHEEIFNHLAGATETSVELEDEKKARLKALGYLN